MEKTDETQAAPAADQAAEQAVPAQEASAQETPAQEAPTEDEAYEASLAAACMQVDERQVFYKTLRLVRTTHDDAELRAAIAAFPEMACSVKTPRFFLERMRDTGALHVEEPEQAAEAPAPDAEGAQAAQTPAPAAGEEPTAQPDAAQPEQPADAAPATEPADAEAEQPADPAAAPAPQHASEHAVWTLTPAGERVLAQLSATRRLSGLYAKDVELAPAFDCILDFCREPRTRMQVEAALRDGGFLNVPGIETSFYVDRLERDGGLVWDHGWLTTEDGLAFLEQKPDC